jgi:hypothetical protein
MLNSEQIEIMDISLPLDQMTIAEKLRAMETLWADLSRDEANVPSPTWHADVLEERDARLKAGQEKPVEWHAALKELRERLK